MSSEAFTIKGIRHGLLISLRGGEWDNFLAEFDHRLETSPSFFQGARVSLDVGSLELTEDDLRTARDLLKRRDVVLHAVISTKQGTEAAAQSLGLVIDLGLDRRPLPERPSEPAELKLSDAVLWQGTLRSGQIIRHMGHVIIVGDVNPGAEVLAGGHILIWGRLRGTVHAGVTGDEGAMVCALDMSPTQLRIAGHITRSPEDRRREPTPEIAAVRDGQIVAMPWK